MQPGRRARETWLLPVSGRRAGRSQGPGPGRAVTLAVEPQTVTESHCIKPEGTDSDAAFKFKLLH